MVEMHVLGLTVDPQTKTPIVVLCEKDGETILPIWVGAMEAMAVSLVLHKEDLPRPLTHDLMLLSIKALKGALHHVEINDLKDGVYYAELALHGPEGESRVDCRPSDAVALALRADVPILVSDVVLQRSAVAQSEASRRLRQEGPESSGAAACAATEGAGPPKAGEASGRPDAVSGSGLPGGAEAPHAPPVLGGASDLEAPDRPEISNAAVRKAEARHEADQLGSLLISRGFLPEAAAKTEEERLRELLRSLDPVSSRKM